MYRNVTGMSALTGDHRSSGWDFKCCSKLNCCDDDDVADDKVLAWNFKRYYFYESVLLM